MLGFLRSGLLFYTGSKRVHSLQRRSIQRIYRSIIVLVVLSGRLSASDWSGQLYRLRVGEIRQRCWGHLGRRLHKLPIWFHCDCQGCFKLLGLRCRSLFRKRKRELRRLQPGLFPGKGKSNRL